MNDKIRTFFSERFRLKTIFRDKRPSKHLWFYVLSYSHRKQENGVASDLSIKI